MATTTTPKTKAVKKTTTKTAKPKLKNVKVEELPTATFGNEKEFNKTLELEQYSFFSKKEDKLIYPSKLPDLDVAKLISSRLSKIRNIFENIDRNNQTIKNLSSANEKLEEYAAIEAERFEKLYGILTSRGYDYKPLPHVQEEFELLTKK
jgi:hypothetical protein